MGLVCAVGLCWRSKLGRKGRNRWGLVDLAPSAVIRSRRDGRRRHYFFFARVQRSMFNVLCKMLYISMGGQVRPPRS